jgi:anti-anti-sigma factor
MMPARRCRAREGGPSRTEYDVECDVVYGIDEARVSVRGDLCLETVARLRRIVLAAAALPIAQITVDLAQVESLDLYSANALFALRTQVRERSTRFVLVSESPPVRRTLEATGFWDMFEHGSFWSEYPPPECGA